jgi:hypothetical protein
MRCLKALPSGNLLMSAPKKAPPETRILILDALMDPKRRFLDNIGPSRRWIDQWDLTEEGFFHDLCEDLRIHEIFLKPKNKPSDPQKYQTRLIYGADPPDYPEELNIHITLSPKGDPPTVKVVIHRSDTARELPKTKIETKSKKQ